MTKLIDKTGIFAVCLVICLIYSHSPYLIIPILFVIIISALNSYLEKSIFTISSVIAFTLTALFFPEIVCFLPLICYDCFKERYFPVCFILIIPSMTNFQKVTGSLWIIVYAFVFIAYILKYHTVHVEKLRRRYINLRDDLVEFSRTLEKKNKVLMEKQDYEVNLATLNERNRIAREIHDSVGHVMSSAILQVGALMATVGDGEIKANLTDLKGTLTSGMNSIRNSVHDLHDNSVDLFIQLGKLVNDFTFCPITFDYDMGEIVDTAIIYAIIAIVKEALANIMKHSNASHATLTAREHPGLYQVIVFDNGTLKKTDYDKGMGLNNIRVRVESLNGIFNINYQSGFRLFVSIPKEVKK